MQVTLTPIQFILTILLVIVAIASLRLLRNRLMYRLVFLAIVLVGILFVAVPYIPYYLAQQLGVGRGVDLVFYLLFTGILLMGVILYRRILEHDLIITQLIRQNAIRNAIDQKGDTSVALKDSKDA
ncbi:hypothetical protein GCM10023189_25070 [Nibrella saemangeumensis]|uniref:DUF2304 domain-containing protein n=1 Tax=Nibrella saemangeumensis TaxID=1084526 RepID=A0ABP8MU65_9BACT